MGREGRKETATLVGKGKGKKKQERFHKEDDPRGVLKKGRRKSGEAERNLYHRKQREGEPQEQHR